MIQIWYHASCYDGFCAAWVAHRYFLTKENVLYTPVNYGQAPPNYEKEDQIYLLDFSYDRETMLQIASTVAFFRCLDHHESAKDAIGDLSSCFFDMSKSGARLAWEYFFTGVPVPWLVSYTEDRDLWKWKLIDSREVNAGLRTYEMDFEVWDSLKYDDVLTAGKVLNRYLEIQVKGALKHVTEWWIGDRKFYGTNCTSADLISDVAGEIAKEHGIGMTFFVRSDGMVIYSLRSRSDIDVCEIAKSYGGGGHPQAAGFELDTLPRKI